MPFSSLTESGIYYILLIVVAKKVIDFAAQNTSERGAVW